MPDIHLTTFVAAPKERVFDLSRSLSIYKRIFNQRPEQFSSTAGSNVFTPDDTVLINAKHFGKVRSVTLRITSFNKPWFYIEEQVRGDLHLYRHEHHFKEVENGTIMIDLIKYDYPVDMLGKFIGALYMQKYIESITYERNRLVKEFAESEKWKAVSG